MKKALPWLLSLSVFSIFVTLAIYHASSVKAAATHVVISQIQVAGATANDEFVELYNPTNSSADLTGWRLKKESSTGGSPANLIASISGSIASHGYFLIAFPNPNGYTGSVTPDAFYSATSSAIAANNSVLLYSDAGVTLVDKVGMGTATDNESADAPEPSPSGSIQRKLDDTNGHGLDTDNNSSDFEALAASAPRNSSTVVLSPSPTPTPTATSTAIPTPTATPTSSPSPTPSPTSTPTATPTSTPTASPSPTSTPVPTATPTSTPTPTPTASPVPTATATPTLIPTSTPTVAPTITPSPSSTATPFPTSFPFPFRPLVFRCRVNYITINTGWFFLSLPQIFCGFNL
jgi:hypothetical protein